MGHLTAWCEHHNIPYQGVPVGTIKKHATGKGNAGIIRTWLKDDAVGLQAFVLATRQLTFERAGLIDQHASQAIASGATLPKAQLDKAALTSEHLG